MAEDKKKTMTTDAGRPVGDNQNSLTVGPRGFRSCSKISCCSKRWRTLNRERVPRARGARQGARAPHGLFRLHEQGHHEVQPTAKLFRAESARRPPRFIRLLDGGRRKKAQPTPSAIPPAAFALKFYTEEGKLGYDRQTTRPVFLHPRSAEVRRFHSHPEARSPKPISSSAHHDVGLLGRFPPEFLAPGDDPFSRIGGTPDGYRHMDGFKQP